MTPKQRDIIIYSALGAVLVVGLVVLFFVGPRWLVSAPTEEPDAAVAAASVDRTRSMVISELAVPDRPIVSCPE